MKATLRLRRTISLVAFVGFLAASQSVLAAAPKTDARAAALVAALQAVSPDPLGGRLGLAALADRPAIPAKPAASTKVTAQASRTDGDHRAYLAWKSAQKS